MQENYELLLNQDVLLVNRGMLAEQLVAGVDFVTTVDANIIPIEVKAGATGRLKSLKLFMEEKKIADRGAYFTTSIKLYGWDFIIAALYGG